MFQNKSNKLIYFILILFLPITFLIGSFFVNFISILISIITLVWLFYYKKLSILIHKPNLFFLLLFGIFLICSLFSNYKLISFENSISYYLNFILFLSMIIFFFENETKIFILSKVVFIIVIFLCFDLWFQYIMGHDIFGFPKQQEGYRLTAIFKDEQIPGSVIFRLLPFVIYFLFKSNDYIIKNLKYLIFIIVYFSILITGERASSILSTLLILFLLFFNLKDLDKKKLKIYGSLFLFIFIILLNLNNSNIKERIFFTFEQSKNNIYIDLYSNSLKIFKKNKVIGTGLQTYRIECPKFSKKCSTHPHNFLLELLSDTGMFATILFLVSLISLIYFKIKKISNNFLKSIIVLFTLLFFFPIIPTGSFFNSFHMTLTWMSLGFLYSIKKI